MSQRTRLPQSLLLYSEAIDTAASWPVQGGGVLSVTQNAGVAPNGATTAEKMVALAVSSNVHRLAQTVTGLVIGCTYVFSVFAKASGYPALYASCDTPATAVVADLSTGLSGLGTPTIVSVGSGWYRVSFSFIATATSTPIRLWVFDTVANAASLTAFTGDGTSGILVWGAQLEQSDAPGDYVATTAAAVNSTIAPARRRLPQNVNVRSNDANNWSAKSSVTAALNATGPDGVANTASTITDSLDGAPTGHYISNPVSGMSVSTTPIGSAWCFSAIAKAGTKSKIGLCPAGAGYQVTYDLAAGTVGQSLNLPPLATGIVPLGGGWYRCWVTLSASASDISNMSAGNRVYVLDALNSLSYQGAGTGTLILGDIQLEQSDYPGDVARTTTVQINPTIAPQRRRQGQNRLLRSQIFDNASWVKTATTVTADSVAAPDGTVSADRLVETAANSTHGIQQNVTTYEVGVWTCSVFAKQGERSQLHIDVTDNVTGSMEGLFNLAAGTASAGAYTTGTWSEITYSIVPVGNGWYRCSASGRRNNGSSAVITARFSIYNGALSYVGDVTKGLYLWGAQLEQSNAPGDYTPTTAAAVNATLAPPLRRTAS